MVKNVICNNLEEVFKKQKADLKFNCVGKIKQ